MSTTRINLGPIYVASKAHHAPMWLELREQGWPIISTWIDEAGEGETNDFADLWTRITQEVSMSEKLVFFSEPDDFPNHKGAFVECGMALVLGKPVLACLPRVELVGRTFRPVGSWVAHPLVKRVDNILEAMGHAVRG